MFQVWVTGWAKGLGGRRLKESKDMRGTQSELGWSRQAGLRRPPRPQEGCGKPLKDSENHLYFYEITMTTA